MNKLKTFTLADSLGIDVTQPQLSCVMESGGQGEGFPAPIRPVTTPGL